ncbi:hypothetical protein COE80_28155 [Bacillus pseudomycoides]|uniref:hypothetical protein n=1 Tax=Bacillus pseudomycoides TaxID=64104 RepID=UPI000BFC0112|nr:hypothetical protein [Bacillus pseudomycoides]PHB16694.1 hypothetical protein COE80_28155 [Bacillus pseudomycoides]
MQRKAEGYIKGVSKQVYLEWKETQVEKGQTLHNLEGSITGYTIQAKKENKGMGYMVLLQSFRRHQEMENIADQFYETINNPCNGSYVEKTKFG